MKKLYTLALMLFVGVVSFAQTIYSESMGATATANPYPLVSVYTGFQNTAPIVYTGTGDVRSTSVSNYVGASGGNNVWLGAVAIANPPLPNKYFQIDGINTSAYTSANIQMSFGHLTTATTALMVVEYSTNASSATPTWTPVTYTNNTGTTWTFVTVAGGILPSSATLSLRFTGSTSGMRLDDVKVFNYNPACSLVLGAPTVLCDAVTFGMDTYTATIPYTGGGTGNHVMTPTSGTVGGDNPNTVAAGNITVSGITEGVGITLDIVNGVCTYSSIVIAPECKPENTLPYYEGFDYAVGASLGAQQRWTNVNSGDDVVIAAGSLSYPTTATSTGNSASFLGAGKDPFTPFTQITSGTIFASVLIKVADLTTTTSTTGTYFLGLTDSGKGYQGRLFAKPSGTGYVLGFDSTSTTTNYATTVFNVNDTVLVVMSFDFNTLTYSVWFNPDITLPNPPTPSLTKLITLPTPPAVLNFGGFQIRQETDTATPSLVLDELRIAPDFNSLGLNLAVAQNEINGLKVYPNPVKNGNLFITSDSNNAKTVVIYDIIGKQVVNTTITNQPVNVASLKAGIYVVKITEDGKTATRKLVIE